nr:MAG TPA: hypothetical protein [Caudoviricetes sp.]
MRNPICVSKNAILKFLTCLRSFWISSLFSSISRLLSCFLSHLCLILCFLGKQHTVDYTNHKHLFIVRQIVDSFHHVAITFSF